MATNDTTVIGNMFDVMKFKLPNGQAVQRVAATLAERDDFTRLVPAYPANNGLTNHGLRQVSLPTGYLVDVGGSWKSSKGEFEPIVDTMCTIRSTLQTPKSVYQNCPPEVGMQRLRADKASHIMALNQGMTNMMLDGPTTPDLSALIGLKQRAPYTTYDNKFCFSAGGTGSDLRSCWLMKPGIDTIHALYNPYHPTLGVEEEDKGEQLITGLGTSSDEHRWDLFIEFMLQKGFHIEDQRAVKRICNVACGVTDNPGTDLINTIFDAANINAPTGGTLMSYDSQMNVVNELPSPWLLFCDERLYTKLVRAMNDSVKIVRTDANVYKRSLPMLDDIIICRWDALNKTIGSGETAVAAA
jgi:hypothetical protein